ncbi:hypothetical protein Nepgr_032579 [Nepenthes gracilis]|uniref:Uroporphyrinogen decarboxylase (URO-D) domain-containing protein n=1 Tax=Nepenthes gracilis TaxID=150966 RepID=A0AAD3Y8E5_NEPGR|nr:hypothetical protein Nepgr_032579 [Nepenthes gracilis]
MDQSKASVLVPDPTLHGLNNLDAAALVVDHASDAVSHNKGKPLLLSTDDFVQPDAKLEHKKSEAPVLFRGVAPLLNPVNSLVWKILPVSPSTYSDNPNTQSITARSLDCVSILGSLSLFSGFALRTGIQKSGSSISFGKSSNEPIMVAHGRLGYLSLSLSRQTSLWPLEMNSDPPPQQQLAGNRPREAESKALGQPGTGSEGSPGTAGQRVTLRLLTSWCDTQWVKMGAIATMIVPTLGTLILIIGANGFTAFAQGSLVTGCGKSGALYPGKWLHGFVIKTGTLLDMYVQGGNDIDACSVFACLSEADFFSWTAMVMGYTQLGHPSKALELMFDKRWIGILPNSVTTASALVGAANVLGLVNLVESLQHGSAGAVAPSLLETGKAFTAKRMLVLENVGKETMDLLILETGIAVESSSNKADHQANGDLSTQMTFDRCFYIYGGPIIHSTLRTENELKALHSINFEKLQFVGESLSILRHEVGEQAVVFGFVGAPWTIVAYIKQTAVFGITVLKQPLLHVTEAISS